MARRELGVRRVGRAARLRARGHALLPARARATRGRRGALLARCAAIAVAGIGRSSASCCATPARGRSSWSAWLYLTPLWAVLDRVARRASAGPIAPSRWCRPRAAVACAVPASPSAAATASCAVAPELLRLAMCAAGVGFLAALAWWPSVDVDPAASALTWGLGHRGRRRRARRRRRSAQRAGRATRAARSRSCWCSTTSASRGSSSARPSFDNALAVLRQIATRETDHANLVPIVTLALVVGFAVPLLRRRQLRAGCAIGSSRCRRGRRAPCSPAVALVLRELGHAKIVPFIYFQF